MTGAVVIHFSTPAFVAVAVICFVAFLVWLSALVSVLNPIPVT